MEEDLVALMKYWKEGIKFCENVKILELDDPREAEFVIFEGCNLESLEHIFLQCPYLVLTMNDDAIFRYTGVDLEIAFLLTVIWIGEG
jgi:hypothetical protein